LRTIFAAARKRFRSARAAPAGIEPLHMSRKGGFNNATALREQGHTMPEYDAGHSLVIRSCQPLHANSTLRSHDGCGNPPLKSTVNISFK